MRLAEPIFLDWDEQEVPDGGTYGLKSGMYVVRSSQDDSVFRFGKAEGCVMRRIKHHSGQHESFDNISGDLMPYSPSLAWVLDGWPSYRVEMAELSMIGALSTGSCKKYFSDSRKKSDKSNFKIDANFDWQRFKSRVTSELDAIASLGE
jgi:hypothetical protein